ncbi:MAG: hypothetical protein ACKOK7_02225 [Solirubrobacterales bacterium]
MRSGLSLLALCVVAASLAACGSNDKLSEDQAKALKTTAQSFEPKADGIEKPVNGCAALAQAGQMDQFKSCLSDALKSFEADIGSLGSYVDGLSSEVEGECKAKLDAWVKALDGTGDSFGKAADEAQAGDYEQIQGTLKGVNYDKLATAGNQAATACTS